MAGRVECGWEMAIEWGRQSRQERTESQGRKEKGLGSVNDVRAREQAMWRARETLLKAAFQSLKYQK